jgi:uncharacterized protein (TIGR00369 family)
MANVTVEGLQEVLRTNFAPWVQDLGLRVEHNDASGVRIRLPFNDRLCRVGGMISGQALAAACDTAMVLAVFSASDTYNPVPTIDLTINFMRPLIGSDALLRANVVRLGRTIAFCTTDVVMEKDNKACAFATGNFAPQPAR